MDKLPRIVPGSKARRPALYSRTALCGALSGLILLPSAAQALPLGGGAEVNAGGGMPVITSPDAATTNIQLNAQRTVLSWGSYDLKPDETVNYQFGAKNWIVLNRIIGLRNTKIEGTITGKVGAEAGGNIWFVSNGGIIFGKTAQVDAGGFLAMIGTPDIDGFLNPANTTFSVSGSDALPGSKVFLVGGAKISGHGSLVGFAGPSLVTRANAMVTVDGGGNAFYGAAKTFQIRLAPGTSGGFDLVDFIVPTVSGGSDEKVLMDLAGDTKANSVFLAAVSKSAIGSTVINLEGLITATGATADGGDIVLSSGGNLIGKAPSAPLADAAPTDVFLNKASASRDVTIRNVGRVLNRPWVRPPEESKDPTTIEQDEMEPPPPDCVSDCSNGFGNGNSSGPPPPPPPSCNTCGPPSEVDLSLPLSSLFDPTAISAVNAGRDARVQATASIELGRVTAGRDLSVTGPSIKANSLIATGALSATASTGDVILAGVGVAKDGVISGASGDVRIDAISAPQKLSVTAGRDIFLGDGTSTVSGVITLKGQNVNLELASARIDTVTATSTANLRGGALDIGAVTAPRLFAKAESVKIGTATSSGDIYVVSTSGDAVVGQATSGDDVFVLATHGTASLGSATLTGAGPDGVSFDFDGSPDVSGNGRIVRVESSDLDAKLGLTTGSVTGATAVTVKAGRDAIVDLAKDLPGTSSVIAARDATLRAPTAKLDTITAGRDLTFATTSGDLTLTTNLVATRNISISAGGALKVADVRADSGSVLLSGSTVNAGAVSASEDLTLKATSGGVTTASFKAGRDLIVQGSSLNLGSTIGPVTRDLSITSLGNFTSTTPLSAGRNLTIDVAGNASLGQLTAAGLLRIVAGDLDLTGTATAANAQIESRSGALRVGGSAGAGAGLQFDSNDFGQLRISGTTKFYAGSTTGTARGDLTLQSLTTSTANTPNLVFLVAPSNNALVQGAVAPSASGGVLRIGDATDMSWRPGSILITGSLGAATVTGGTSYSNVRAYDEVRLAARNDILMGSQRFITLIQGTDVGAIDTAKGLPAGVAPTADETNKVFVAAGRLEVSSINKVVQQNTAPGGAGAPVGVFFTGKFATDLIIDPPKIVELWGALAGADGKVVGGAAAGGAVTFMVVDAAGAPTPTPPDAKYKFNSCDVGTTSCSAAIGGGGSPVGGGGGSGGGGSAELGVSQTNAGVLAARDALSSSALGSGSSNSNESESSEETGENQVSGDNVTTVPTLLAVTPPVSADDIVTDPVTTGTGSEEIWRKRKVEKSQ